MGQTAPNHTHHELIAALFGPDYDPKTVHVASFPGDPHNKEEAKWHGARLSAPQFATGIPVANNNFVCMGRLDPTTLGRSIRDVTHHVAFWMDDVGTKVPLERVNDWTEHHGLPPTAIMETSPGNFSYFWALSAPVQEIPDDFDAETVAAVRAVLKRDGWGDPAAQDSARYMRIEGVNGKKAYRGEDGKPFTTRLVELSPSNAVALSDFAEAIIGPDWAAKVRAGDFKVAHVIASGNNDRAATMDDPLVKLAAMVGLNPQPSTRAGVIDCSCPNEAAHTGGDTTGYAIINDGMSFCNHASCQHLKSPDFADMMVDMYDQMIAAGIMFGKYDENPAGGGVVEVATGEVMPSSGMGFLAAARFEGAPMDVQAVKGQAEELAHRQAVETADREHQEQVDLDALKGDLIHVDAAEAFWSKSKRKLMAPSRLDKDADVLKVFEVGTTGKQKASNKLLNSGIEHAETLVCDPGGPDIVVIEDAENGENIRAVNTYVPAKIGRRRGIPKKFLAHIDHMFPGQPDIVRYLIETFAWFLQNPGARNSVITLLGGDPGIGKDFVLQTFFKLVGNHNVRTASVQSLLDGFNDFLTAQYVVFGEFTLAGRDGKRAYLALKDLTGMTEDAVRRINPKYGKAYTTRIRPRFFATTNDADALPDVTEDDRRFNVAWSSATRVHGAGSVSTPMSDLYFDDLWKTYSDPAELEILNDYLLSLPITMFSPNKAPPRTSQRHDVLVSSLPDAARFAYDLVVGGDLGKRHVFAYEEIDARAKASDNRMVREAHQKHIGRGLLLAGCKSLGQVFVGGKKRSLWTGSCLLSGDGAIDADRRKAIHADHRLTATIFTDETVAGAAKLAGVS